MSTVNYNTRIKLKYDSYANWTSINPILLDGELAITAIATGNTQTVNSVVAPQVLIKVGDGVSTYNALPFISGLAADVYDWAKSANKPVYNASEITGMGDYIANYVDETLGISVDTNTVYKVELTQDGKGFVLSSQNKGETAWSAVATLSFADVFDAAGAAAAVDTKLTSEVERATAAEEKVLTDANAYTDEKIAAIPAFDDTELRSLITAEQTRAETAEGANADALAVEVARAEAAEKANADAIAAEKARMDAFMAAADVGDAAVDTMKEIQEYITSDGAAAAQMVNDIAANKTAIEDEVTRATSAEAGLDARLAAVEAYDHTADVKAAKDYADSLAGNYDPAGSAATAKSEAITDADTKLAAAKTDLTAVIDTKVDKVEGMGLSHNDFTDDDATKLLNIEAGAEVNVIETIKVNGVALPVTDKSVNIEVVHNIDDLEQDAGTYVIFNCGSATVNI